MASDPQLELRVSRLENDVISIYEILTEMRATQQEHSRRLDAIEGRLDGIDTLLGGIEAHLNAFDGRLDAFGGRLDAFDGRLDGMGGRFDSVDAVLLEVLRRLPEPA